MSKSIYRTLPISVPLNPPQAEEALWGEPVPLRREPGWGQFLSMLMKHIMRMIMPVLLISMFVNMLMYQIHAD